MPWKRTCPMDQRFRFVAAAREGIISMAALCRRFGISRKTGYKWLTRYETEGMDGLKERSRAPCTVPHITPKEVVDIVVKTREAHPFWGPKKLKAWLEGRHTGMRIPAASTIGDILKREGLTSSRRRRRRTPPYSDPFIECTDANDVWCADFKGQFRTQDKQLCYPLTIMDAHSRYLLRCHGLPSTRKGGSKPVFEAAFQEYGLPQAIRTDNGAPFASRALGGLSQLAVWWIKLGIVPERIDVGCPEQNGRHERMHRTLKAETAMPSKANMAKQQVAFDQFCTEYNQERPHEALGQKPPASLYKASARPYPKRVPEIEYPAAYEVRRVTQVGQIVFRSKRWQVSMCLAHEPVGLCEFKDGQWMVYFGPMELAVLDEREDKLRPLRPPAGGRTRRRP